jgi:AhpD family alkylhydroperoxidase
LNSLRDSDPEKGLRLIKYIHVSKPSSATGLVAEVYSQIKNDFGRVVEPFQIHSPIPKLLAGAWMACRESELVGQVPRNLKEAVAAAVSQINQCSYCVDAHTIMLIASGQRGTASAISNSQYKQISDSKARMVVDWALATASPRSQLLRWQPFSREEAPEMIGTAVFYHYMNRMANALLGKTPLPSSNFLLRKSLKNVAGVMFSNAVQKTKVAGRSSVLLPKVDLPNDLRWAKPSVHIAHAYACFAKAIEEAGEMALPIEARAHVEEELVQWTGKTSELSLAWAEDAVSRFDEATESAATLALLTAISPNHIDNNAITAFRKHFPEDEKLVGALAWASFAAARKIGTWLQPATS